MFLAPLMYNTLAPLLRVSNAFYMMISVAYKLDSRT